MDMIAEDFTWPETEGGTIMQEEKDQEMKVEIPKPYHHKAPYKGIRDILVKAAKSNPYAKKIYCAPDISEKRAKKAAEAYAMQISWKDIIVLEEYPSMPWNNNSVIYTDTILDSSWIENNGMIKHNSIVKVEKIGGSQLKFYLEPSGDMTLDFGPAADSIYYMVSEIIKATRNL